MVRLNLAVSAEVRDQIEQLRDYTGAESLTEVVRHAVETYDRLLGITEDQEVILRNSDGSESRIVFLP